MPARTRSFASRPKVWIVVDTKLASDENYARLMEEIGRATDAMKAGATKDRLAMQVKTDDLGWQFNPQFFAQLYEELK